MNALFTANTDWPQETYTSTVYVPYRMGVEYTDSTLTGSFTDLATGGNSSLAAGCVDSAGNVYCTGVFSGQKLSKVTQGGTVTDLSYVAMGTLSDVEIDMKTSPSSPILYSADKTNLTVHISYTDGGYGGTIPFSGLSSVAGVAVDGNGNVYVADPTAQNVQMFTVNGGVQSTVSLPGVTTPNGLAFDRFGNLYVSDTGTGKAFKRTPGGTVTDIGIPFASGTYTGYLTVDDFGTVYAIDRSQYKVLAKKRDGTNLSLAFPGGGGNSGRIMGIAVGYPYV